MELLYHAKAALTNIKSEVNFQNTFWLYSKQMEIDSDAVKVFRHFMKKNLEILI